MIQFHPPMLNRSATAGRNCLLALIALLALTIAAFVPQSVAASGLHIEDHEDFLQELIEMDAAEIRALGADLDSAIDDVYDAVQDVREAKRDVADAPLGDLVANAAFRAAGTAVNGATGIAFSRMEGELDKARQSLDEQRSTLGEAEYQETRAAIDMVEARLEAIARAVDDLIGALRE